MSEPLRILILAANPLDTDELALRTEHRLLRNKMRANAEAGNCELLFEWAARLKDLKASLVSHKPHVIHFAGHGTREGICLEDDEGKSGPVTKAELADLFSSSSEHLRLVVLNACFSALQVETLRQSVDYVVGTKAAVSDEAAVRFAAHFYEVLAIGSTVREAYAKSQGEPTSDHKERTGQYELLVRSGADETKPLLLPKTLPPKNRMRITIGNADLGQFVGANVIGKGTNESSSSAERAGHDRNEFELTITHLKAARTCLANELEDDDV
jgi:hypothetical protein